MDWREAFLLQARSDFAVLIKLNKSAVEDCHRLHYLQMAAEKLGKAMLSRPGSMLPPVTTHAAFARMLQVLKSSPEVRRHLGFNDPAIFKRYIDSLLPLAERIERLAPALAGMKQPNPEYPWADAVVGEVFAPAAFAFTEFNPKRAQMIKMMELMQSLLTMGV